MAVGTILSAAEDVQNETSDFAHSNHGYTRFCEALNDNRLKAGMTLTQSELSDLLGISLSPLRETLVLLEEYGLIEIKQRSGIRIFYPQVSFIRENMQYRSMIEIFAIPVFVRNATESWLSNTREQHVKLRDDWGLINHDRDVALETRSRQLDRCFHASIVETLANAAILDNHQRICHNIHLARKVHQTSFGKAHYLDTIDEHLQLINAIQAGDTTAAEERLEDHFRSATHRLFIAP